MKIFATFLILTISNAYSYSDAPEELVKQIFQSAQKLKTDDQQKIESRIDFSEMSRAILAEEFKKQGPEEIKWFTSTIKEIITKSVYPSAPKFLENVKITYKKTQITGAKAKVSSSVSKKGESTDVDYILSKQGDEWKIIDVSIDEESWVKTINEKVQKTLKEKGWSGLKNLLKKRLEDLNKPVVKNNHV